MREASQQTAELPLAEIVCDAICARWGAKVREDSEQVCLRKLATFAASEVGLRDAIRFRVTRCDEPRKIRKIIWVTHQLVP